jgi:hypothetical protein
LEGSVADSVLVMARDPEEMMASSAAVEADVVME